MDSSGTIEYWTKMIERHPKEAEYYFERGRLHYRNNDFGEAINDFNRALELDPGHTAARQMWEMAQAIFNFRNFDLYNP
ncbi:tetratricopeptide repeat protein [uncultured Rikenella sp.]|uniref:tetratricopeptide repeat protein n=1 Tax=uncultured Rikenella sp. TaxID=368003 RepID=UPI00262EF070|nr:tetratricopeptide repeat protein [uncultured Rikenella sp.]